ncbi:hypothetical protein AB0J38_14245 [Streptomyces sp. NPDC050095]|uniref:hypothetical protein n=1 Tax=unclassified Streptomyces TaxID=2593676 RepID=UPI003419F48A
MTLSPIHPDPLPTACRERELSYAAQGVLARLRAMPSEVPFTAESLTPYAADRRDRVRGCLRELAARRWLVRFDFEGLADNEAYYLPAELA